MTRSVERNHKPNPDCNGIPDKHDNMCLCEWEEYSDWLEDE